MPTPTDIPDTEGEPEGPIGQTAAGKARVPANAMQISFVAEDFDALDPAICEMFGEV